MHIAKSPDGSDFRGFPGLGFPEDSIECQGDGSERVVEVIRVDLGGTKRPDSGKGGQQRTLQQERSHAVVCGHPYHFHIGELYPPDYGNDGEGDNDRSAAVGVQMEVGTAPGPPLLLLLPWVVMLVTYYPAHRHCERRKIGRDSRVENYIGVPQ